ncbi:MAG: DUF6519 domain-containing protein [Candidatus Hodarchaeota archaeon]
MRGDFTRWRFDKKHNFNGVLHQQGKVLLDSDWNDQVNITMNWQDQLGDDVIGLDVVAIPISSYDGFKVTSVEEINEEEIKIQVNPGRAWINGVLVYLEHPEDIISFPAKGVKRIATPLFGQDPISDYNRAVILLEVWREELNAFQETNLLLEPALGGIDTTERVLNSFAFKFHKLTNEEKCGDIKDIIKNYKDELDGRGRLTVKLADVSVWPYVVEGSYSALEHRLYRIEIAKTNRSGNWFKWSQNNGKLVGIGSFEGTDRKRIKIEVNQQAINYASFTTGYLEATRYNTEKGHWETFYGANVDLLSENYLRINELEAPYLDEYNNGTSFFFRLWNGIEPIDDYMKTYAVELKDRCGIKLKFHNGSISNPFRPYDYWTFPVRLNQTSEVDFPNSDLPQGRVYHLAPLAIIQCEGSCFNSPPSVKHIHDCRAKFQPLTNQKFCPTVTVGALDDFKHIHEVPENMIDELVQSQNWEALGSIIKLLRKSIRGRRSI